MPPNNHEILRCGINNLDISKADTDMHQIPNINHLRSLVTVARLGSISAAAGALLRSQSTISLHIHQLEENFGQALFHRHARGVYLTREGAIAVDYSNQILGLAQRLHEDLSAAVFSQSIRLGLCEDYAIGRLPHLLRVFADVHETLDLQLVVDQSSGLDRYLRDGEIDLALAVPDVMSFEPIALWTVPLFWVANRNYLFDTAKPLPLVTTTGGYQESSPTARHPWDVRIQEQLKHMGISWRVACTTSTVATTLAAVEAGIGIGYVTRESVKPTLRILTELDGVPPPILVEFGLFTRSAKSSPDLEPLVDILTRTVLGNEPI